MNNIININDYNINEELPTDMTLNNKYNPINDIQEISNIYPNNLTKYIIHASQRNIISKIRAEAYEICRSEIPYDYIRKAFNKFKNGYIYYHNKELIAFCIWDVKEHFSLLDTYNVLHIYIICGKKLDFKLLPHILDDIVHYCRKNKIRFITLEPVNDIMKQYYIQNGFDERYSLNNSPFLSIDVNKARYIFNHHNSHKIKSYTRKLRKI
jgi:hypothetical protein